MAIHVLSPNIYNRIAAGEVVEKPASVFKELVENSLDAGASEIRVEIEEGGTKKIVVSDNGCGISKEDLPLAFLPHATSKVSEVEDLEHISTLGFRGEALASISAVSFVSLSTKVEGQQTGFKISSKGGQISSISEVARLKGTTVCVENLFFNVPARLKFLRKNKVEESEITHLFEKFMMAHPEVNFVYVVDGKELYSHSSGTLEEVAYLIYGKDVHAQLKKVNRTEGDVCVSGYVVSPKISRPNRTCQSLFVNGRYVENYMISACVQGAFSGVLMKNRFPIYILKIDLPPERVDVNVHPNKREVKFDNPNFVFGVVRRAVEDAIDDCNLIAEFSAQEEDSGGIEKAKGDSLSDFANVYQKQSAQDEKISGGKNSSKRGQASQDRQGESDGLSYQGKADDPELAQNFSSPKEYQEAGVDIINMPDFSSVKSDRAGKPKNRPGGNIYFDNSGSGIMHEVDLLVEKKKAQEEKTLADALTKETEAARARKITQATETTQLAEEKDLKEDCAVSSGENLANDVCEFERQVQNAGAEFSKGKALQQKAEAKTGVQTEEESFLRVSAQDIKVLGVAFKTYIITEFGDALYVIDQHAMHERQNYDKLKAQVEKGNVSKQDMLVPYEFTLQALDAQMFSEKLENLKEIGFEISQNENHFSVKSVPFVLAGMNVKKFVEEVLDESEISNKTASDLIRDKLAQTACKHSIRAGDSVSRDEIFYLIERIKDGVPLCPHGRPIIVKITRAELEKMFKRTL